jgi:hypothetical protein
MARRSVLPPKPKPPVLTVGQKRRRVERLQKCMQRIRLLIPRKYRGEWASPKSSRSKRPSTKPCRRPSGTARLHTFGITSLRRSTTAPSLQLPRWPARSCVQLADQEGAKRRFKKRANIFPRARSGRSPCCRKRSAHLKAKSSIRNRSRRRHKNPKALLTRITRHRAPRWPKPPRRQPNFGRSSPDSGAASISKRHGVVWDDGGEGAINEPARS